MQGVEGFARLYLKLKISNFPNCKRRYACGKFPTCFSREPEQALQKGQN